MKAPEECANMGELRDAIDSLDADLIALLAKRFAYIDRAAQLKPAIGMPARTTDRVQQVIDQVRTRASALNLDPDLIETLWRALIENSITREEKAMGLKPV